MRGAADERADGSGARLEREWRSLSGLVRTLMRVRSITAHSPTWSTDDLEAAGRPLAEPAGAQLRRPDARATARWTRWPTATRTGPTSAGLRRGDVVALLMPNRLEYLPIWYGLSKVGVVTALINNQLTGDALAHCLNVSGAGPLPGRRGDPAGVRGRQAQARSTRRQAWTLGEASAGQHDLTQALRSCSSLRPDRAAARA